MTPMPCRSTDRLAEYRIMGRSATGLMDLARLLEAGLPCPTGGIVTALRSAATHIVNLTADQIEWTAVKDGLPDEEITVLVAIPAAPKHLQ